MACCKNQMQNIRIIFSLSGENFFLRNDTTVQEILCACSGPSSSKTFFFKKSRRFISFKESNFERLREQYLFMGKRKQNPAAYQQVEVWRILEWGIFGCDKAKWEGHGVREIILYIFYNFYAFFKVEKKKCIMWSLNKIQKYWRLFISLTPSSRWRTLAQCYFKNTVWPSLENLCEYTQRWLWNSRPLILTWESK